MAFEFNLKVFFVKIILIFLFIIQFKVFASTKLDCKEKAFYVKDVMSDAKHKDLTIATFADGVVYNVVLSVDVKSTFAFTKLFDINLKRSFVRLLHPLVLVDMLYLIFVLYCQDLAPEHQQHLDYIV